MSQWNVEDVQVQVNLARCVELIQFVILIYDWLLTFGQEYERFWQSDLRRLPAILFFVNRYLCLFGNIPVLFLYFWADTVSFDPGRLDLSLYVQVLIFAVQLNISVLFVLRVTALYGGSSRIRIFLYAVVFVMVGNTLAQLYLTDTSPPPVIELSSVLKQIANVPVYTSEQGRHLTFLWLGMFVFDLSVFSLTLWKTLSQGIVGRGSVLTIVVRDGSMYFGIITLFTLANILVFALGAELIKGLFPTFFNILSSVFMSRLMLNLREERIGNPSAVTDLSGIEFASSRPRTSVSTEYLDIALRPCYILPANRGSASLFDPV